MASFFPLHFLLISATLLNYLMVCGTFPVCSQTIKGKHETQKNVYKGLYPDNIKNQAAKWHQTSQ